MILTLEKIRENIDRFDRRTKLFHEQMDEHQWEQKILEGFGLTPSKIKDAEDKYGPKDGDLDGEKEIFEDAKAGDELAIYYIANKLKHIIAQGFWKFLGPDNKHRARRIKAGQLYEYISLAYGTLTNPMRGARKNGKQSKFNGLISGFDTSKVTYGTIWKLASSRLKALLKDATSVYNAEQHDEGIVGKGSNEVQTKTYMAQMDDKDAEGQEWKDFDKIERKVDQQKNLSKWKDFCQDEQLNEGNPSAAKILKYVIENPTKNRKEVQDALEVASNTVLRKLELALQNTLSKYELGQEEFKDIIDTFGANKQASYFLVSTDNIKKIEKPKRAYTKRKAYGKRGSYKKRGN